MSTTTPTTKTTTSPASSSPPTGATSTGAASTSPTSATTSSSSGTAGAWQTGNTPLPENRRSFKLWGDPHAVAGDGKKFDNEQVGTITQLKSASGDLELQTTQEHPPGNKKVTVNTAAALKLGNNLVSLDITRHQLVVNKKAVKLKPGTSMDLPGGGTIKLDAKGQKYTITSAKDDVVNLTMTPGHLGVPHLNIDGTLGPTRTDNEVRGALGNFHAGNGNDFVGRDGKAYDAQYGSGSYKSIAGNSTYNKDNVDAFEKSWMAAGPSLLTQNQGQGTNDKQWQKDTNQIQQSLNNSKLGLAGEPWQPGAGSLHGADTSSWQSMAQFMASINGAQWTALKATQGTGYNDPTFQERWKELGKRIQDGQMSMRMAYHFLDPGNGTAQAKHFLSTLGINGPLQAGTRLALDWEGPALNDPQALHDAANYIHQVTGTWPVVYTSASEESAAKSAAPSAPLWIAHWGVSPDKSVPFVQYSDGGSSGIDQDVFNGDLKALRKFAGFNN